MKDWGNRIEVKDSDELLEGIEAIGISDKDNDRLKKKVLMRAGLEQHSTVRNRRHARRTVLLVAAILMCTIGVFAATQFGALELFWGGGSTGVQRDSKRD